MGDAKSMTPRGLMRRRAAFTLVELLVAVAIMAVMLGLIVPAARSMLEGSSLTRGGQLVADQISLARQVAAARSCVVEVRLIRDTDITQSGYNLIQLWKPGTALITGANAANMVAIDKLHTLPASVVIAGDRQNLSPLLGRLAAGQTMSLPGRAGRFDYMAFQIKPTGEITPVPAPPSVATVATIMSSVYLTVVLIRAEAATSLPPNFALIQINPYTGTPNVYRP